MLSWASLSEEGRLIREAFERDIRLPGLAAFQRGDNEEGVRLLTGGIVGAAAMKALPEEIMRHRHQNMQSIRMLTLSSDEFPFLQPQAVAAISVPTLLMAGERTPAIHGCVYRALCKAMPQAMQRRIPQAGHAAERDNPVACMEAVGAFFRAQGLSETL